MDRHLHSTTRPPGRPGVAAAVCLVAGLVGGAGLGWVRHELPNASGPPPNLAAVDGSGGSGAVLRSRVGDLVDPAASSTDVGTTPDVDRPAVPLGTPDRPFVPLADDGLVRAVRTESGLVLPVVDGSGAGRADALAVLTACEAVRWLPTSDVEPVGRAHVVLDPGHGGTEVGAVGPSGLAEKDINLQVAEATRARLEERGATVVVSRNFDHNLTTATRGRLAAAIEPALFVSIHHNGGAPPSGDQPGVMAFTKVDSAGSKRFGGLFYHRFTSLLAEVAAERAAAYNRYRQALDDYAQQVADYDRRVAEWRAASAPPTSAPEDPTTAPAPVPVPVPATTMVDGVEVAVPRDEIPEVGPPPTTPDIEPVRQLVFAGGGNRGVRSWIRPDGQDYLSTLRTSEDVPAVLAEFLYLTNRAEEELLLDPAFIEAQAEALTTAIVDYFSGQDVGVASGYVDDQFDDQPIGGGGRPEDCVEPPLTDD